MKHREKKDFVNIICLSHLEYEYVETVNKRYSYDFFSRIHKRDTYHCIKYIEYSQVNKLQFRLLSMPAETPPMLTGRLSPESSQHSRSQARVKEEGCVRFWQTSIKMLL